MKEVIRNLSVRQRGGRMDFLSGYSGHFENTGFPSAMMKVAQRRRQEISKRSKL
jgi:hypothetical protein